MQTTNLNIKQLLNRIHCGFGIGIRYYTDHNTYNKYFEYFPSINRFIYKGTDQLYSPEDFYGNAWDLVRRDDEDNWVDH